MPKSGFELRRLSETVWRFKEFDNCDQNVFIYVILPVNHDNAFVIDTGTGENNPHEYIHNKIFTEQNIPPRRFVVINTHNHFDHVGGNNFFQNADDCDGIWASGANEHYTNDPVGIFAWFYGYRTQPYTITRWLQHKEHIALSDCDTSQYFTVLHTPGHTPDSICIYYSCERRIFAGDTIYSGAPVLLLSRDSRMDDYIHSCDIMTAFIDNESVSTSNDQQPITLACGHQTDQLAGTYFRDLSDLLRRVHTGDRRLQPLMSDPLMHMYVNENHTLSVCVRRWLWADFVIKPFIRLYLGWLKLTKQ